MPGFNVTKRILLKGLFVAATTALIGFQGTGLAAQGQRLWSIVVHFQYPDGFEFDYVIERGVSTRDLSDRLAECGRSHHYGQAIQYHCYPVAE